MQVIVKSNYDDVSSEAYKLIVKIVEANPNAILGLATGSSPIGLYNNMIDGYKKGMSYKEIRTVNLDEYIGLGKNDSQSYITFMKENLFSHIDINLDNVNLPNGLCKNQEEECQRYTALLATMQQDIQILGIGSNGHIGFNEPGTAIDSTTNIVKLKESTRLDNQRFFSSLADVPTHAITMGIKNIMMAKSILVVATGKNKAEAVYKMIKGPVSIDCPASILQLHNNCTVIIDTDAASKL